MNIRTSILAVGVTLALVAPAAASARAITNQAGDTYFFTEHSQAGKQSQASQLSKATQTYFFTEHSLGFASHSNKKATHAIVEKRPNGNGLAVTGPIYIYEPAPAIAPSVYVDPNECMDTGGNCTPEELCTYWGENCDVVTAIPQDVTAQNPTGN
jgi:hypothetical protein